MAAKFALLVPGFFKIGSKTTALGLKSSMAKPISLCRLFRRHFEKSFPRVMCTNRGWSGPTVKWLHDHKLTLNFDKTKCMLIGSYRKHKSKVDLTVSILDHSISTGNVRSFKYLCIHISLHFTWTDHIDWESQSEAWASQAYKAFTAFQGTSTFL